MSTIRPFEQKHNAAISHGGVNTDMWRTHVVPNAPDTE
jgi:hypothetical protein